MATKEVILQNIQRERDRLCQEWKLYQSSLRIIEDSSKRQLIGKEGFDTMAVYMAQGIAERSAKDSYDEREQEINAKIEELQAELEELPEYKYEKLVSQKQSASTKSEFSNLAWEFRKLERYRNSRQLANDCENTANRIAEQERQEQKRIEQQEREKQYNELLAKKRLAYNEKDFTLLANDFRVMKDFRDAVALAEECGKLAEAAKEQAYEKLLLFKRQADQETEPDIAAYRKLAGQFDKMGSNYKDAVTLSKECERIAFAQEQKNQYLHLLSRKRNANGENDFKVLINEFRAMGDYQDVEVLAQACEKRYQELKSERIHGEYTHASMSMQRLKKMKTRKPDILRTQAKEWEQLYDKC